MLAFLLVLGTIIGTVLSQLLIKAGVLSISRLSTSSPFGPAEFLTRAFSNPFIMGGLAAALGAAVSWIFAMRVLPLNFAYPFTALTIVLVVFLSTKIFQEQTNIMYWVALCFIIVGILLLFFSKPR